MITRVADFQPLTASEVPLSITSKQKFNCQGEFWRESNGIWEGSPVYELSLERYYKSLKNRSGRTGDANQSLAITETDMKKLHEFLEAEKSNEYLVDGEYNQMWETKCRIFAAIAKTGWTLWTRFLSSLYFLVFLSCSHISYMTIFLPGMMRH